MLTAIPGSAPWHRLSGLGPCVNAKLPDECFKAVGLSVHAEGLLIIPVQGEYSQSLYRYHFDDSGMARKRGGCGVGFVPLKSSPT
jgi:protein-L-isoaspartate O-methyltransferase